MEPGTIVETVGDFEALRKVWSLKYPKKGDILTVSAVVKHPNGHKGMLLLYFNELPGLVGIANKTIHNEPNFVEVKLPDEIYGLLTNENTSYTHSVGIIPTITQTSAPLRKRFSKPTRGSKNIRLSAWRHN